MIPADLIHQFRNGITAKYYNRETMEARGVSLCEGLSFARGGVTLTALVVIPGIFRRLPERRVVSVVRHDAIDGAREIASEITLEDLKVLIKETFAK